MQRTGCYAATPLRVLSPKGASAMQRYVATTSLHRRMMQRIRLVPGMAHTLGLVLVVGALLAACGQPGESGPHATVSAATTAPTATTQPSTAMPAFSDWRVAYLHVDGYVHAVTLDGKTDVAGPELSDLNSVGMSFASGGASPDGRMIAYAPWDVTIVDLTSHDAKPQYMTGPAYSICWSADGRRLALDHRDGSIAIGSLGSSDAKVISGVPPNTVGNLIGWIDSAHLAVTDYAGATWVSTQGGRDGYSTSMAVASLDITSGHIRVIATIRSPGLEDANFWISPDGTKLLMSNSGYRDYPYTPLVDLIDVASGAITPLPTIDRATGSGFMRVAWQKGTDVVAVSTNVGLSPWVLNLRTDSATQLPAKGNVGGWSPDNSTLVLTGGYQTAEGGGSFPLTALTFTPGWQVASSAILTQTAQWIPFIGFVRTA